MTIEERVSTIENEVKRMKTEHASLLERFFGPADRSAISELEHTLELTKLATDQRIAEIEASGQFPPGYDVVLRQLMNTMETLMNLDKCVGRIADLVHEQTLSIEDLRIRIQR